MGDEEKRLMMKQKIFLLIVILATINLHAQEIQPFEAEISGWITYPTSTWEDHSGTVITDNDNKIGLEFGVEGRYNFRHSPLDVGLRIDYSAAHRKAIGSSASQSGSGISFNYDDATAKWRVVSIVAMADYNFPEQDRTSFFIGAGLGYDSLDENHSDRDGWGSALVFIPRIGIEVHRFVRLTLDAHITKSYYNTVGLNVGLVLGGRDKKS